MATKVSRRTLLATMSAAGLFPMGCGPNGGELPRNDLAPTFNDIFRHGVASGDPQHDSVVIWTRVETEADEEHVIWELSEDKSFEKILQSGETAAQRLADHTVKVIPQNLKPGATYYYRFTARNTLSPVGRTKTLAQGTLDKLGIALVSCSNFTFGFFNAYDAIARDENIDFVLHTGDYIYEHGVDEWGGETGTRIGRAHDPVHETVTLDDYRKRHAQYKRDNGSLAMHAAHPLLACWDDHESTNNPWKGGAQNHQPETEGDWQVRLEVSLQAYYEWMPIRDPQSTAARAEFWRSYVFGDLATMVTLETRHTARDQQVEYGEYFGKINNAEDAAAFKNEVIGDPGRRMISAGMEEELRRSLGSSVRANQPWRLIGNASPIARMLVPNVAALGVDPARQKGAAVPETTPDIFWKGRWNLPFYTDTWDGYPAARERFYDLCRGVGASDLLFLTGDSHSFWANALFDDDGAAMGLELGTAGVSSPGDFVDSGWDLETAVQLDRIFASELDEVMWTDNLHQGYVRVILKPDVAEANFVAVDNVLLESYTTSTLRSVTIRNAGGTLSYV